jgi:hypothetical protein
MANEIKQKHASETRTISINYTDKLDTGEALTGTPTVAEVSTSDLTISGAQLNSGELTINGETVAASKAVQCQVAGGTSGSTYSLSVTVSTDATSPGAQTFVDTIKLEVL